MTQESTNYKVVPRPIIEVSNVPSIRVSIGPSRVSVSNYYEVNDCRSLTTFPYVDLPHDIQACNAVREFLRIRYPESENLNPWIGTRIGNRIYIFTMVENGGK